MKLDSTKWAIVAGVAGAVATLAARKATTETWKRVAKEDPPTVQDYPDAKKLLLFTGLSALVVALASTSTKLGVHALRDDTKMLPKRD